jgi:hypothetical protein
MRLAGRQSEGTGKRLAAGLFFIPMATVAPVDRRFRLTPARASRKRAPRLDKQLFLSVETLLVTEGLAFYNPSITAFGAVVWFTHASVFNRQIERLQPPRASA